MDKIRVSTFPETREEAITLQYLSQFNYSNLTPEEYVDKYVATLEAVKQRFKKIRRSGTQN